MKQPSYIVKYRDSEKADELYFGTFVSPSIADFFRASLPMPLKGGTVRTITLQPYQSHEGHTVSQMIEAQRLPTGQ